MNKTTFEKGISKKGIVEKGNLLNLIYLSSICVNYVLLDRIIICVLIRSPAPKIMTKM